MPIQYSTYTICGETTLAPTGNRSTQTRTIKPYSTFKVELNNRGKAFPQLQHMKNLIKRYEEKNTREKKEKELI